MERKPLGQQWRVLRLLFPDQDDDSCRRCLCPQAGEEDIKVADVGTGAVVAKTEAFGMQVLVAQRPIIIGNAAIRTANLQRRDEWANLPTLPPPP